MSDTIILEFADGGSEAAHRIAGRDLITRPKLPRLRRFRVEGEPKVGSGLMDFDGRKAGFLVRRVSGLVAGRERAVDCWSRSDRSLRLEIEGIGAFELTRREGVAAIRTDLQVTELAVAGALGPALALALAWSDVWILHGSALSRRGRALVFVGPGGVGKSTLAEHLASRSDGDWRLLADDQLPVRLEDGEPEVLPRFPQPRWGSDGPPGDLPPEVLPLAGVYRIGRPSSPDSAPACEPLAGHRATSTLIHQTIGASLLDDRLLERHLEFCGRLAETVPIFALRYPLDRDRLPEVEELLASTIPSDPAGSGTTDLAGPS